MSNSTVEGSVGRVIVSALVAALVSSGVITFIGAQLTARRAEWIVQEVRAEFDGRRQVNDWKRQALATVVAPVVMQLDRTKRAFTRYEANNRFIEAEILFKGNLAVRDLLLAHGHLIPDELRDVSGRLIEHYDRWLEEYDRVRGKKPIAPDEPFVFVGPKGYPFPPDADALFLAAYKRLWTELYGSPEQARAAK